MRGVRSTACSVFPALLITLAAGALIARADPARGEAFPPRPVSIVAAWAAADSLPVDLGPTSAPAWTPPEAVPAAEPWEGVLRLPGRVVSLPLSGLGWLTRSTLIYVEESSLVPRALYLVALQQRIGLYAMPASLGDRTGFGGALRYVPPQLGNRLSAEINGSTAGYNSAMVALREGPARLQWFWQWRAGDQFFGIGPDARDVDPSNYAFREQQVRLTLAHAVRVGGADGARAEAEAWIGPREAIVRDGRADEPDPITMRFPTLAAAALDRNVEHLIYGTRLAYDARHGRPHWSGGWRADVSVERYDDAIEALAIRDAGTPAVAFTRITCETEMGVSFGRDPRTLRLLLRVMDQKLDGDGVFLLPDLARLGGSAGLAGFEPGRFHGTDLAFGRLSYIFPLAKHFEFDLHAEAGSVFGDLADARIRDFRHVFGLALRPRLETAPLGLIGVEWSKETVRFGFTIGGVE